MQSRGYNCRNSLVSRDRNKPFINLIDGTGSFDDLGFASFTVWNVRTWKTMACPRGMACNFIHCFWNPGGDYEWVDWDKPPPRYWLKKMVCSRVCKRDPIPVAMRGRDLMVCSRRDP